MLSHNTCCTNNQEDIRSIKQDRGGLVFFMKEEIEDAISASVSLKQKTLKAVY